MAIWKVEPIPLSPGVIGGTTLWTSKPGKSMKPFLLPSKYGWKFPLKMKDSRGVNPMAPTYQSWDDFFRETDQIPIQVFVPVIVLCIAWALYSTEDDRGSGWTGCWVVTELLVKLLGLIRRITFVLLLAQLVDWVDWLILGGGNSNIVYFHPIWLILFRWVETTN